MIPKGLRTNMLWFKYGFLCGLTTQTLFHYTLIKYATFPQTGGNNVHLRFLPTNIIIGPFQQQLKRSRRCCAALFSSLRWANGNPIHILGWQIEIGFLREILTCSNAVGWKFKPLCSCVICHSGRIRGNWDDGTIGSLMLLFSFLHPLFLPLRI